MEHCTWFWTLNFRVLCWKLKQSQDNKLVKVMSDMLKT